MRRTRTLRARRAAGLGPAVDFGRYVIAVKKAIAILLRAAAGIALLLAAGCLGARGDIELVEARLRQQQDLADRYARDLLAAERERDAARHEAELLRRQIADGGQAAIPPELAQSLFQVRGIEFNTLMTGGRDRDGQPGDDVIVAVFVPRDEHGDVVKLPGAIELEALDLNRPDDQRQVGKWTFSTEESRKLWKSGAFNSGYQLEVPLPNPGPSSKIILHARLATADGRQFDATHTVKLKPATAVANPSAAPTAAPLAPPAADSPGRAVVTPVVHEEIQPVTAPRQPRPATLPLATEATSPQVPVPADDAFTPPDDTSNPFADPPSAEPAAQGPPTGAANGEATVQKPAMATSTDPPADQPPPFPDGLQTSDNFTDETLPFLR